MSTTVSIDSIRNGVDTGQILATLEAIDAQPELGRFQFRVTNRWIAGAHNTGTIREFSDEVRNGFQHIHVSFRVDGDAPEEKLRELVERAQQRSAVFDMVTRGVPVSVESDAVRRIAEPATDPVAGTDPSGHELLADVGLGKEVTLR